jgi:hypothetical protein
VCQYQLRFALDSNEAVGVTDFVVVRFPRPFVSFLFLHESPNLIALYVFTRNVSDAAGRQPFTSLSCQNQQREDGGVVHPGVAFDAGNAHAFDQQAENLRRIVQSRVHAPQRALRRLMGFQERLGTLAATKPLDAVSVLPKSLTRCSAVVANHRESPLEIHSREADN